MNYRLTELKVLLFLLLLSAVSCQRPMYDEEDDEDDDYSWSYDTNYHTLKDNIFNNKKN